MNRCLNRLVKVRAPAEIIVEKLDFRAPGLSRRMNRLLSNMGRGAINAKLRELEERFGIKCRKVNAAYSSQTDSACGYVDKKNRKEQARFRCLWCGHKQHADVNAARNLRRRSAETTVTSRASRDALLETLIRQHLERFTRPRGRPADPRLFSLYFKSWADSVTLTGPYT